MKPISGLNTPAPTPPPAAAPPAADQPQAPADSVEVGGERSWGHTLARGAFGTVGGVGGALVGFAAGSVRHAGDASVNVPTKVTRGVRFAGAVLGLARGVLFGLPLGPGGVAVGLVLGPLVGATLGGALVGGLEAGADAMKGGAKGLVDGAKKGASGGAALADRWFGPKTPDDGKGPEQPAPPDQPAPPAPDPQEPAPPAPEKPDA